MKQGDFVIRPAARGNDGDFSASVRLEMKTGFLGMEKTELINYLHHKISY